MAAPSFRAPDISFADLQAFQQAHFSQPATDHFLAHFLRPRHLAEQKHAAYPAEEKYYEDEEDDGLGYYEDGVKRTLTDDDIAWLRNTELKSLRRAQEKSNKTTKVAPAASPATPPTAATQPALAVDIKTNQQDVDEGQLSEEGELSSAPLAAPSKKKKKNKNKNKNNNRKGASYRNAAGELIDLRKRTWDVVDKGLTSLDYDEEMNAPPQGHAAQRQRISYDD